MAGALTAAIAAAFSGGGAPVATDPYFEYTTLLLPGNGTNGAQNNTFLDGSTNNFTITRNGNTTQGTFSPFSQTGWGNYFNGTNAYLSTPSITIGSGDFTIEGWQYILPDGTDYGRFFSVNDFQTSPGLAISFNPSTFKFEVSVAPGSTLIASSGTFSYNTWYHIALVRSGGSITLYINGTSQGSASNSTSFSGVVYISAVYFASVIYYGASYTSNVRITTTAIVPPAGGPTAPLTAVTGTLLLTCQSNRFIDTNTQVAAKTITVNGSPAVVAFSPFNPTASWSAATYGGSGYFDGSGDFLNTSSSSAFNLNGVNWTIECFIYLGDYTGDARICTVVSSASSQIGIYIRSGTVYIGQLGVSEVSLGSLAKWQWYHIAFVNVSGTITFYVNGSSVGSTSSYSLFNTNCSLYIAGSPANYAQATTQGYISDFRVVKGTAVYTGNFTPPTAPITNAGSTSAASYPSTTNVNTSFASSATSLLLNFTNAGVYDATSKNDLETVGNAQISNTTAQFGGTSIKFNGTTDYLVFPSTGDPRFDFGTGDFTVECWIYLNSIPSNNYRQILSFGTTSSSQRWLLLFDTRTVTSSPYLAFYSLNSSNAVTTEVKGGGASGWSSGVWYYVAVTRSGNDFKLFRDGSQNGATVTDADPVPGTSSTGRMYIGSEVGGALAFWDGYIQDVRITRGYARPITAKPTAAFPTL